MAVFARSHKVWQSQAAPDRARLSYAGTTYSQRRTARTGVLLERLERLRPLGSEEQRAALGRGQPRDSESGWSAALCLLAQRR